MPSIAYTVEHEIGDGYGRTAEFSVEFSASQYFPATYDDPAEGGEVEIQEITLDSLEGDFLDGDLTDQQKVNLVEWVWQNRYDAILAKCYTHDLEEADDFDYYQRDRDDRADFPERYQYA